MRVLLTLLLFLPPILLAQITGIPARVDFSQKLQPWDGFGFNYVEAAQSRDYAAAPQDYGGFSLLDEAEKTEITERVFGETGLQVQLVKMFLDPWHQAVPEGPFDHETTTANMRAFVRAGLDLTRARGDSLALLTTLYGPPAWATQQGFIGGRDLDPRMTDPLCGYMADWVAWLRERDFPVTYLSLHNEGEDFYRWDFEAGTQRLPGFDYNHYWPPEQVNTFLKAMPAALAHHGLSGKVGLTNGEPSNWTRFYHWGYAHALANDPEALANLDLITTHGFINGEMHTLSFSSANALVTNLLREEKPGLHAWVTSFSWGKMDVNFVRTAHEHIYAAKVNALIPWAGIQNPSQWIEGDPNPGSAIRVHDDGRYEILPGYYYYQQLTRAGKRGMAVAQTFAANPQLYLIAFASNGTGHPDALIVTSNIRIWSLPVDIEVNGTNATRFRAYRTTEDGKEQFEDIGVFELENGVLRYDPPPGSTTTFLAEE